MSSYLITIILTFQNRELPKANKVVVLVVFKYADTRISTSILYCQNEIISHDHFKAFFRCPRRLFRKKALNTSEYLPFNGYTQRNGIISMKNFCISCCLLLYYRQTNKYSWLDVNIVYLTPIYQVQKISHLYGNTVKQYVKCINMNCTTPTWINFLSVFNIHNKKV